jgi:hypothetical protein
MAKQFLKYNTYPGQRNCNKSHVRELEQKQKDGRFHVGSIAISERGGIETLMNGQHQCEMCVSTKKPFTAVLQHYDLNGESPREEARLFAQHNVDKPRTRRDIGWIYAIKIGWQDWPKLCVTRCMTALGNLRASSNYDRNLRLTKDENADLLFDNKRSCEFVYQVAFRKSSDKKTPWHIQKAPVVAAMIRTWKKSKTGSLEFWVDVRDGEDLKSNDPAFVLREWLKEVVVASGSLRDPKKVKKIVMPHEIYWACIFAWNKYREGKKCTEISFREKAVPVPK